MSNKATTISIINCGTEESLCKLPINELTIRVSFHFKCQGKFAVLLRLLANIGGLIYFGSKQKHRILCANGPTTWHRGPPTCFKVLFFTPTNVNAEKIDILLLSVPIGQSNFI